MTAKAKPSRGNTLIYGNRKEPETKWDISTPGLRAAAFLELFKHLKKVWQVYSCGYWGKDKAEQSTQKELYRLAVAGSASAAEKLLTMRIDYEYEEWYTVDAPVTSNGEPKKVLAAKPGKVFVKDIRRQSDSGRYSFVLNTGEEIEMMYVPVNTTRSDWVNGNLVHHFLIDSFYEKLGRDRDNEKKLNEVLSHLNYMRLTLYYTMFPERMPLGKSLPLWQKRSLSGAESYIGDLGANPVEKLKEQAVRPTKIQKAQNVISELILNFEGLISSLKRAVDGKEKLENLKEFTLPSYDKKLEEIKKGMVDEL